jgi:crossover junction endodeoxyribonuclease RuvC
MPVVEVKRGKGLKRHVSAASLAAFLSSHVHKEDLPGVKACLEQTGAMTGQGVTSMFSMGRSLGIVEGVLAALQIPIVMVGPARWKRDMGLLGQTKDASRERVVQLFPGISHLFLRKKDHGRAEAALIALWLRQAESIRSPAERPRIR